MKDLIQQKIYELERKQNLFFRINQEAPEQLIKDLIGEALGLDKEIDKKLFSHIRVSSSDYTERHSIYVSCSSWNTDFDSIGQKVDFDFLSKMIELGKYVQENQDDLLVILKTARVFLGYDYISVDKELKPLRRLINEEQERAELQREYQEDIYLAEGETVDGLDKLYYEFKNYENWEVNGFKIIKRTKHQATVELDLAYTDNSKYILERVKIDNLRQLLYN
jgi:hypothetical protein